MSGDSKKKITFQLLNLNLEDNFYETPCKKEKIKK